MMSYQAALSASAEQFLINSDRVYEDCWKGISDLDKIIVSVHSQRADQARAYLLPSLYAYWERYFKSVMGEYLSALSQAGVLHKDCKSALARTRIRGELQGVAKVVGFRELHESADCLSTEELQKLLLEGSNWIAAAVEFRDPVTWVKTENNVKYHVLEQNYKRFALDINSLKTHVNGDLQLHPGLEKLVNLRNDIAHGANFKPLTSAEWEELKTFVLNVFLALQQDLYDTLQTEARIVEAASPKAVKQFTFGEYADRLKESS